MNRFHCVIGSHPATLDDQLIGAGGIRKIETSTPQIALWVDAPMNLVATYGCTIGVGTVRLDDRAQWLRRWSLYERDPTDLELFVRAIDECGRVALDSLLGEFAVVIWNDRNKEVDAVRDPFGIHPLFVNGDIDYLACSSHARSLGRLGSWDRAYLADFIGDGPSTVTRTVFAGVRPVQSGTAVRWRPGRSPIDFSYWDPAKIRQSSTTSGRDAADRFRELFFRSVASTVNDATPAWAHLSGGLDSSSIVCVADHLAKNGLCAALAGTITIVDTLGTGDERDFSNAVVQQTRVRNELVIDAWPWMQDDVGPPTTDQPTGAYPFYARERRIGRIIADAGGRVLLGGLGSDHYLALDPPFIADLIATGQLVRAIRMALERATAERRTLWKCLYRYGLYPLLPLKLRARWAGKYERLPPWIDPGLSEEFRLPERLSYIRRMNGSPGDKVRYATTSALASIAHDAQQWTGDAAIEMRYPFLNRKLVEFALTLTPELRELPQRTKRVLREALGPLLPRIVSERNGKGGIGARVRWALDREHDLIDQLSDEPILGELGCVRPKELRRQIRRARAGHRISLWLLFQTLALESWLRVVSGRWPRDG